MSKKKKTRKRKPRTRYGLNDHQLALAAKYYAMGNQDQLFVATKIKASSRAVFAFFNAIQKQSPKAISRLRLAERWLQSDGSFKAEDQSPAKPAEDRLSWKQKPQKIQAFRYQYSPEDNSPPRWVALLAAAVVVVFVGLLVLSIFLIEKEEAPATQPSAPVIEDTQKNE